MHFELLYFCIVTVLLPVALLAESQYIPNKNSEGSVDYSKHAMVRIFPSSHEQIEKLQKLKQEFEMDFSNASSENNFRPITTLIGPEHEQFLTALKHSKITYKVVHQNFQLLIDAEQRQMELSRARGRNSGENFDYEGTYHNYRETLAQTEFLANKYESTAKYISVGKSYEGREIPGLAIGNGTKVVIIEAGIHAREWISHTFGIWLANHLLSQGGIQPLLAEYKFIVVPMLNVDGFAFTHSVNRVWRKTRSRLANSTCVGADANRNWDIEFCTDPGASSNPCDDHYCGVSPFSEIEIKQMSDLIAQYANQTVAFFDIHSDAQMWLYSFGYKSELPPNIDELESISKAAVRAIESVNGLNFSKGSTIGTLYPVSGGSVDWVYEKAKVTRAFTVEMRARDDGFILPVEQIKPALYEIWAGIEAALYRIE